MVSLISPFAPTARLVAVLDTVDLCNDFIRRFFGLCGQCLYFRRDHRESFSGFARAGGFNRRIESKQVGLTRNVVDQLDDLR